MKIFVIGGLIPPEANSAESDAKIFRNTRQPGSDTATASTTASQAGRRSPCMGHFGSPLSVASGFALLTAPTAIMSSASAHAFARNQYAHPFSRYQI